MRVATPLVCRIWECHDMMILYRNSYQGTMVRLVLIALAAARSSLTHLDPEAQAMTWPVLYIQPWSSSKHQSISQCQPPRLEGLIDEQPSGPVESSLCTEYRHLLLEFGLWFQGSSDTVRTDRDRGLVACRVDSHVNLDRRFSGRGMSESATLRTESDRDLLTMIYVVQ